MKRFVIFFLKTRIKSGTPKYPTVQDVFETSINMLTELGESYIVYFRVRRRNWWTILEWDKMSVRLTKVNYFIRVKFPLENSAKRAFEENEIRISEGWEIQKLSKRWAILYVARTHKKQIAPFLNSIYEKFYTEFKDYFLIGEITLREEGGA